MKTNDELPKTEPITLHDYLYPKVVWGEDWFSQAIKATIEYLETEKQQ